MTLTGDPSYITSMHNTIALISDLPVSSISLTIATGINTLANPCPKVATNIVPPTNLNSIYTFTIGSSQLSIIHDAYTTTVSCSDASFTYSATLVDGSALPAFIVYSSSSRTF